MEVITTFGPWYRNRYLTWLVIDAVGVAIPAWLIHIRRIVLPPGLETFADNQLSYVAFVITGAVVLIAAFGLAHDLLLHVSNQSSPRRGPPAWMWMLAPALSVAVQITNELLRLTPLGGIFPAIGRPQNFWQNLLAFAHNLGGQQFDPGDLAAIAIGGGICFALALKATRIESLAAPRSPRIQRTASVALLVVGLSLATMGAQGSSGSNQPQQPTKVIYGGGLQVGGPYICQGCGRIGINKPPGGLCKGCSKG